MHSAVRRKVVIVGTMVIGLLLFNRRLGRSWGSTRAEVEAALPGDDIIPNPMWQTIHGITIRARAADIWPWLVQMGITRGGWYLSQRLDKIVWRIDNPSVDRIVPELQQLSVGDVIPDSVDGTAHFRVIAIDLLKALVLHSRRHPINGVWPDLSAEDPGLYLDFSWVFVLKELGDGTTRLLLRSRSLVMLGKKPAPPWIQIFLPLADLADFIYSRQMLRGIRRRVENAHPYRAPIVAVNGHESDRSPRSECDTFIASGTASTGTSAS